jgi:hypothetical protein
MGIVLVILGRLDRYDPSCYHDDINLEMQQVGRKLREPIELPLRISVLKGGVLSFYVATLAARPAGLPRHRRTHELDRTVIDIVSGDFRWLLRLGRRGRGQNGICEQEGEKFKSH